MKYKRKSEAVALSRDTDAAGIKRDTEPALSRDTDAAGIKRDTEPALSRDTDAADYFEAVLDGITSVGLLYSDAFSPVRYPEDFRSDIEMVGRDMWLAVEKFKHGTQKKSASATN